MGRDAVSMEGIARAGGKRLPAGHQHSLGDSDLLIILWHYHLSVPIFFQEMPDKNRISKTKERRDQADGGRRSLDEGVPERRMDWKDVCMRINEEGGK